MIPCATARPSVRVRILFNLPGATNNSKLKFPTADDASVLKRASVCEYIYI